MLPADLHDRIAAALGWTPGQARSFSLNTLREVVRPVAPALADEISALIRSCAHYTRPAPARRRRW
jgi:hypothetical protein